VEIIAGGRRAVKLIITTGSISLVMMSPGLFGSIQFEAETDFSVA
jgi:hypothetical protein